MTTNLQDLNPDDSVGKYEDISIEDKINDNAPWEYDLVIGSNLSNK